MPKLFRNPMAVIFVTVMVDMLSFGIVIPDLQLRGESLGLSGLELGAVMSSFSAAQLLVSPFAGRISDRYGRRPVLLMGAITNALSFAVYAFAASAPLFFIARVIGGVGASNLSAAYAYVADASKPEERAKAMGMVGAAFGIGFVFGPPLGGVIVHLFGQVGLGLFSCGLAALNAWFIYAVLKDVRDPRADVPTQTGFSFGKLISAIRIPGLAVLLLMFFSYNFAFSNLESTFVLFAERKYGWEQLQSGLFLGYVGILIAITQGAIVGKLVPRFGERNLVRVGMVLVALSLLTMPHMETWPMLMGNGVGLCVGSGITTPSLGSLISLSAGAAIQGGVFGITQSLGALARILGPMSGQTLLDKQIAWPYYLAAGVMALPIMLAWFVIRPPEREVKTESSERMVDQV